MTEEQLNRIEFKSKNKFLVDNTFLVEITKNKGKNKFTLCENKQEFESDDLLFDYLDKQKVKTSIGEMTSVDSVGGGMELPFGRPKNKKAFMKRTYSPYTTVVERIEKVVKSALINEFVQTHPAFDLLQQYQKVNAANSETNMDNVANGIKIVYAEILPSMQRNYYTDNNDYNGDGVPNPHKENATNLDLSYDGASEQFKDNVTAELNKTESGKQLMDIAVKKAQQKGNNSANNQVVQLGGDIEFKPNADEPKEKLALQNGFVGSLGFNLKEGQMYRFKFKNKDFTNRECLAESIPAKVKKDGMIFEMLDGESNLIKLLWEGKSPKILTEVNLLKEEKEEKRISKLFDYARTGTRTSKENENTFFKKTLKQTRNLRDEN